MEDVDDFFITANADEFLDGTGGEFGKEYHSFCNVGFELFAEQDSVDKT
jgi:hypothetical protein